MDENNVRLAFSNKNVGKSYEEIQREAEKSGKKQKTQQEIMQDLGKDIKRMVEAITHSGSLLQEFFTGFGEGLSRSEKGRLVLRDLASLLKTIRYLGREVGKSFVDSFPGVGTFFDGLHEFLKIFKKGVPDLGEKFRDFFKMLSTSPEDAVDNLLKSFEKLTGGEGSGLSKMVEGARTAAKAFVGIFAGMISYIVPKLIEGIQSFTKILADPEGIKAGFAKLGGNAESMFSPLFEAIIKNAGPLWESIKEMFSVGWEKYGNDVTLFLGKVVFASLLFGALKAAIVAIPGAIGSFFSTVIVKKLGGKAGDSVMRALSRAIFSRGGTTVLGGAASKAIGAAFGATGIGLAITAAISASDIDRIAGDSLQAKLDSGELKNSGAAAGGKIAASIINALTFGLLGESTYLKIAESMSSIYDVILEFMGDFFGPNTKAYLSGSLKSFFDLFAGFGDVILGLITGDGDRISSGIMKMFSGMFETVINLFHRLPLMMWEVLWKGIGWLAKMLGAAIRGFVNLIFWPFDPANAASRKKVGEKIESWWNSLNIADVFINGIKELLGPIGKAFTSFYEGIIGKTSPDATKVTDAIATAVIPDAAEVTESLQLSADKIKEASIDTLNGIGDEVGQYSGLNEKQIKKTQENLNAGIKNMQEIVSGIDNAALISMRESINNLDTGALSMFEQLAVKINESINPESMSQAFANMNVFDEMLLGKLESVLTRANLVGNLAKEFGSKYSGDLVTYVEKAANELADLDKFLSDIRIGDLDTTIDNLNNKLLINNKKINIESKPININMNLNVNFDALKFTTSVFTVASNATKQTGDSRIAKANSDLVTARDNFRAGR